MAILAVPIFMATLAFSDVGSRFRSEYPSEAELLKREFTGLRGTVHVRSRVDGKLSPANEVQFATRPGAEKFEYNSTASAGPKKSVTVREVFSLVDGQMFFLEREGVGKPFVVQGYGNDPIRLAQFQRTFGRYLRAPWCFDVDVSLMMNDPKFRILEAREVVEAGRPLIDVSFESLSFNNKPVPYRMAFDPALHWAIVRAETSLPELPQTNQRFAVEYAATPSGRPYIRRVSWTGLGDPEQVCEFDQVEAAEVPESEFRLEHYGLVDPSPKKRPSAMGTYVFWSVIVAVAIVLLIGGRTLGRLATKRSRIASRSV